MSEFLNNYGSWLLFGALFLFMMRMHGGGGCCGGGHQQKREQEKGADANTGPGGHQH